MSVGGQTLTKDEKATRITYLKEGVELLSQKKDRFLKEMFSILNDAIIRIDPDYQEDEKIAGKSAYQRFNHLVDHLVCAIQIPCQALEFDREAKDDGEKIENLQKEWQAEKRKLLLTYDRLITIHREQNFHLQRGTHLRKSSANPGSELSERKLSADSTRLAKEINQLKDKLRDAKEEEIKRKVDYLALKKEHEEQQAEWAKERASAEESVALAENEHRDLYKEHMVLQKLRLDLGDLLSSMGDQFNARTL
ncbi:projectin [Perkinsela sp. CCAP 1560/4]|nr:projectin [Perkinsela sp. CCAP 1560/4]|eukprot:KNH08466.1 projectin [Perkinsela sp. CCAP 1560/4]